MSIINIEIEFSAVLCQNAYCKRCFALISQAQMLHISLDGYTLSRRKIWICVCALAHMCYFVAVKRLYSTIKYAINEEGPTTVDPLHFC